LANWVTVAAANAVGPGERIVVEVEGEYIAVFNVDGRYYAIGDMCTHDGGPLADGDLYGHEIECPRHGARFDIRTGQALLPPAVAPTPRYDVRLEGNDIQIDYHP